ncbi:unnamed protein product [Acanthosepion pharaonis]|uniref:Uncharacterized protein n=1 Tax=Acanthosepion pharaonis TaxID=158019 RepID=A0A812CIK1_ACAPH|nr:unnamed protein product [Sepia pharaonis]
MIFQQPIYLSIYLSIYLCVCFLSCISLFLSLSFLFSLMFPLFFLSFSLHKYNFPLGPAVTEMYTFFLTLVFIFLSFFFCIHFSLQQRYIPSSLWFSLFFLSSSLHNSACNRDIYFLPLWFSLFFKRRLYSQHTNFLVSSMINNSIYRLQLWINEQKYILLYFLSGVAWDESDKFHHYQMSLIFPFISYQRFDFECCSFKDKTAPDFQVIF